MRASFIPQIRPLESKWMDCGMEKGSEKPRSFRLKPEATVLPAEAGSHDLPPEAGSHDSLPAEAGSHGDPSG
jgi:hypothetical protein